MKKLTSKDIRRLATSPSAMARFQARGKIDLHAASKQAPDMTWLQAQFPQLCRRGRPEPAPDDSPAP